MDTEQIAKTSSFLKRFLRLPRLYVSVLGSEDKNKTAVVVWSIEKNVGKHKIRVFDLEDKGEFKLRSFGELEFKVLLKMIFQGIFTN